MISTTLDMGMKSDGPTLTPKPQRRSVQGETWAYCRVSTAEQDNERQRLEILNHANAKGLIVSRFVSCEVGSRRSEEERSIDVLKEAAEEGTIQRIIFSELSRLGRSVGEIARLVGYFTSKNVTLVFLKEGMTLGAETSRDIASKVTLTVFSLLAEIERDLISERTKSALAALKAKGVRLGRPSGSSKLDRHEKQIREWIDFGLTQKAIARHVDCTTATLSLWLTAKRKTWEVKS